MFKINTIKTKVKNAVQFQRGFFGWLSQNKMIYPPNPYQISTRNRLYPTYFEHATELGTIILDKDPLILNFTIPGDKECNRVTQALYDMLSDSNRYPFDASKSVSMASIACDSAGGKELQHQYAVSSIPTLVLLQKQMVMKSHVPKSGSTQKVEDDIFSFIKSIY